MKYQSFRYYKPNIVAWIVKVFKPGYHLQKNPKFLPRGLDVRNKK